MTTSRSDWGRLARITMTSHHSIRRLSEWRTIRVHTQFKPYPISELVMELLRIINQMWIFLSVGLSTLGPIPIHGVRWNPLMRIGEFWWPLFRCESFFLWWYVVIFLFHRLMSNLLNVARLATRSSSTRWIGRRRTTGWGRSLPRWPATSLRYVSMSVL